MTELVGATAALVAATSQLVGTKAELLAWSVGVVNGGPGGNGNYPFTAADGTVILVPCPGKIAAMNGDPVAAAATLQLVVNAATGAATDAGTWRDKAQQWAEAAGAPGAAGTKSAKTHAEGAAGSAGTASSKATDANNAAADAAASRDKSQQWAEAVGAPGGAGTKSAKTLAGEAAASAGTASTKANDAAAAAAAASNSAGAAAATAAAMPVAAPLNTTPISAARYPVKVAAAVAAAPSVLNFIPQNMHDAIIAGTNTADVAQHLNRAMVQYGLRAFDLMGLTLACTQPVTFLGRARFFGNGGTLSFAMADATKTSAFIPYTDANGVQYNGLPEFRDCRILTPGISAFTFEPPKYSPTMGFALKLDRVFLEGGNRTAGTRAIQAKLIDFVDVHDTIIQNYDKGFHLDGLYGTCTISTTAGSTAATITDSTLVLVDKLVVVATPLALTTTITINSGGNVTLSAAATAAGTYAAKIYSDRGNTQLSIRLSNVTDVNTVGFMRKCDKVIVEQVDAMRCGSGYIIGNDNGRVELMQSHVEAFGSSGYASAADEAAGTSKFGYGFVVTDENNSRSILHKQCDAYALGQAGALVGFYKGREVASHPEVYYEKCFPAADGSTGYKTVELHGACTWDGVFTFTNNYIAGDLNDSFTDVVIRDGPVGPRTVSGRSLLHGTKAINLRQLIGTGTFAAVEDDRATVYNGTTINFVNAGHKVTMTGDVWQFEEVFLQQGHYTIIFTGSYLSGTPLVRLKTSDEVDLLMSRQINFPTNFERPMRMPVFVEKSQPHRVGFRNVSGTSSFIFGSLAIVRGTWSDNDCPAPGSDAPCVLDGIFPTCSPRWEGQTLTRDFQGTAANQILRGRRKANGSGTAATTNGSATVTITSPTVPIYVGAPVSAAGVPAGAVVQSINGSNGYTLSQKAAATASGVTIAIAAYEWTGS